jgi:hypothetical protein
MHSVYGGHATRRTLYVLAAFLCSTTTVASAQRIQDLTQPVRFDAVCEVECQCAPGHALSGIRCSAATPASIVTAYATSEQSSGKKSALIGALIGGGVVAVAGWPLFSDCVEDGAHLCPPLYFGAIALSSLAGAGVGYLIHIVKTR